MFKFLGTLISPVTEIGKQYLKNRAAEKDSESGERIARMNARARRWEQESAQAHDLDAKASEERRESYKDEILMGTILAPFWMVYACVIAFLLGFIDEARLDKSIGKIIEAVEKLLANEELAIAVGLLLVAIYGFRGLLRKWMDRKK